MADHREVYVTGGDMALLGQLLEVVSDRWPSATVENGRDVAGNPCYVVRVGTEEFEAARCQNDEDPRGAGQPWCDA